MYIFLQMEFQRQYAIFVNKLNVENDKLKQVRINPLASFQKR